MNTERSASGNLGAFGKPDVPQDVSHVEEPPPVVTVASAPPSAVQNDRKYEIQVPPGDTVGEDICFKRKTTMFLYDMFVELARKLYRDGTKRLIGTPDVKWGLTPQKDGIWIDTEFNWKPEHPEFVPAIYVKLQPVSYSNAVNNPNMPSGYDIENGVNVYERIGQGVVTFVHVSGASGEAISLCDNTRFRLNEFGSQIAADLCLDRFYEQQCQGLLADEKKSRERWQCSTSFAFQYTESWAVKKESPILRSVDMLQERPSYGKLGLERDFPTPTGRRWSDNEYLGIRRTP